MVWAFFKANECMAAHCNDWAYNQGYDYEQQHALNFTYHYVLF